MPILTCVVTVDAADVNRPLQYTSQSPAVRLMLVKSATVRLVRDTGEPVVTIDSTYSPTLPAPVLSFVVVPTIPPVVGLNVTEVNVPASGVLAPITTLLT